MFSLLHAGWSQYPSLVVSGVFPHGWSKQYGWSTSFSWTSGYRTTHTRGWSNLYQCVRCKLPVFPPRGVKILSIIECWTRPVGFSRTRRAINICIVSSAEVFAHRWIQEKLFEQYHLSLFFPAFAEVIVSGCSLFITTSHFVFHHMVILVERPTFSSNFTRIVFPHASVIPDSNGPTLTDTLERFPAHTRGAVLVDPCPSFNQPFCRGKFPTRVIRNANRAQAESFPTFAGWSRLILCQFWFAVVFFPRTRGVTQSITILNQVTNDKVFPTRGCDPDGVSSIFATLKFFSFARGSDPTVGDGILKFRRFSLHMGWSKPIKPENSNLGFSRTRGVVREFYVPHPMYFLQAFPARGGFTLVLLDFFMDDGFTCCFPCMSMILLIGETLTFGF